MLQAVLAVAGIASKRICKALGGSVRSGWLWMASGWPPDVVRRFRTAFSKTDKNIHNVDHYIAQIPVI